MARTHNIRLVRPYASNVTGYWRFILQSMDALFVRSLYPRRSVKSDVSQVSVRMGIARPVTTHLDFTSTNTTHASILMMKTAHTCAKILVLTRTIFLDA